MDGPDLLDGAISCAILSCSFIGGTAIAAMMRMIAMTINS